MTGPAVQDVIAGSTGDDVITTFTVQGIGSRCAGEGIGPGISPPCLAGIDGPVFDNGLVLLFQGCLGLLPRGPSLLNVKAPRADISRRSSPEVKSVIRSPVVSDTVL